MKKIITFYLLLTIFFTILNSKPSFAQVCQGDVTLSSQAEVDVFTCAEVTGNLIISGNDIINLNSLSILTKIGGNLVIENNSRLETLDGLFALSAVGKDLLIQNNILLSNVNALSSLTGVGGRMTVVGNDNLTNLVGFSSIGEIHGLSINDNLRLTDISGLSSLLTIVGDLNIQRNENLDNLNGLNTLTAVIGNIDITNNPKLTDINGFNSLVTIRYNFGGLANLSILQNGALINLQGFSALTNVGNLLIEMNNQLRDLEGFSSLVRVTGFLSIRHNESLKYVNGFKKLTEIISGRFNTSGGLNIAGNPLLESFLGLSSLRSVFGSNPGQGAHISINDNPSLKNIDGLSSLATVSGSFRTLDISRNALLENIDGLSALRSDGIGPPLSLTVTQNPSLTDCDGLFPYFESLGRDEVLRLESLGTIKVSDNGAGCTVEDILNNPPIICNGDIVLSTQAEVDAFNCEEVTGSLTISGNDITNLNALSTLKRVGGHLMVTGNGSLPNVDGLSALNQVGVQSSSPSASITISNNPVLKNLDGFSSLTIMNGAIIISDNPQLETVNGFLQVTRISFELRISNNDQLKSINGFKGLRFLRSFIITSLTIDDNASLLNIDGLSSLESVGGKSADVQITNNGSLSNINGLKSLTSISSAGSSLNISRNPALKNLDGLASLSQIGLESFGSMVIESNTSLENIDGLARLRSGPIFSTSSRIIVIKNTVLSKCDGLFPLLESMGSESLEKLIKMGNINVSENGAGCTIEDIIASGPQSIKSFSLINEETGEVISQFKEMITLDVAKQNLEHFVIQANTFPKQVGSIEFRLDDKIKHTENVFPYIFEVPHHLSLGTHTLKADVYSEAHRKGEKGIGLTATVNVINSSAVVSYSIVNTSGTFLRALNEGDVLYLDDLKATGQTIVANTTGQIGSVKFFLNNSFFNLENVLQYTLTGDNGIYFNPWIPQAGAYTLTATPYSESNGGGLAGQSLTIHFIVKPETAVVSYSIVNTSGTFLRTLNEGDILYLDDLKSNGQTIVANTTGQIGSVKFFLNNSFFNLENVLQYTLTGDNGIYFNPWIPQAGAYTLTATPYSESNGGGVAGRKLTIHLTVKPESLNAVVSYDIVNTSGKFVRHLNEGDILYLDDLKSKGQTIVANTRGPIGSVKFFLNNSFFNLENVLQYTLTGDNGIYFNPWIPQAGAYTLTATPYSKSNGGGVAGRPLTIHYTVVDKNKGAVARMIASGSEEESLQGDGVSDVTIYPVPVDNELFVKMDDTVGKDAILSIITIQGVSVYEGTYSKSSNIRTDDLKPGVYVLHVVSNNGFHRVVKFIKK